MLITSSFVESKDLELVKVFPRPLTKKCFSPWGLTSEVSLCLFSNAYHLALRRLSLLHREFSLRILSSRLRSSLISSSLRLGNAIFLTTIPESSYKTSESLFWKIVWALQSIVSLFKFAKGKSGSIWVIWSLKEGTNASKFHKNRWETHQHPVESLDWIGHQQNFFDNGSHQ